MVKIFWETIALLNTVLSEQENPIQISLNEFIKRLYYSFYIFLFSHSGAVWLYLFCNKGHLGTTNIYFR